MSTEEYPPVSPFAIASLLLMLFLTAIDTTILSTAMPRIVELLGNRELYHWVFSAFMLTSTLGLPFYGRMADQLGIRPCVIFAGVIFLAGSALCALSSEMLSLILGRAIQGLGAAGLQGLTLIAFGLLFSPEQRGAKQSLISMVWGFSTLAGPVSGGYIVSYLSWRWIFGFNVILGIVALTAFALTFPRHPPRDKQTLPDVISSALLLSSISALVLLSGRGQAPLGGLSYLLIFAVITLFIQRQRRLPSPLIPLRHFHLRVYQWVCLLGFCLFFTGFTSLTYIPYYLQNVLHYSPELTGLLMTPMMFAWPLSSALSGVRLNRLGFRRLTSLGALFLGLHFTAWGLIALGVNLGPYPLIPLTLSCVLLGLGMGCINPILMVAAQTVVPRGEIGVASTTLVLLRNLGTTLGISLMGALQVQTAPALGLQGSLGLVFLFLWVFVLAVGVGCRQMPAGAPADLTRSA